MTRSLVIAALLLALLAPAAGAGTVGLESRQYPDPNGDECSRYMMCDYRAVVVRGAGGEANAVTVTATESGYVFRDAGAPLQPGAECVAEQDAVVCPHGQLEILLGDGDDSVTSEPGGAIDGGAGNDTLTVTSFTGTLRGGDGDDTLTGGRAADVLHGEAGNDVLRGGAGLDLLDGGAGADQLDGREGDDAVTYITRTAAVTVDLAAGRGGEDGEEDRISAVESAVGGEGDDTLRGAGGHDTLYGGDGDDDLAGRGGKDSLQGDDGDDVLRGGAGRDRLDGGDGRDRLLARDGARDRLAGGSGRDVARADAVDRARGIEVDA
jgi:Ca2+-binding RTX toxin-like protein